MVHRRRGGTCSEQTLLYAAALEAIGFTFTAVASRVRMGEEQLRPATHASLRVEIDGEEWFTDVGFGACSPPAPMRLKDGESVRQEAWVHTLVREPGPTPGTPGPLVLRCLRQDGWHDLYAIGTEPRFPIDYTVTSHFTSTHPLSPFHARMLVQRSTPGHRIVLHNLELTTLRTDLTSEKRRVLPGELPLLLENEFGVHLDTADTAALVARYT